MAVRIVDVAALSLRRRVAGMPRRRRDARVGVAAVLFLSLFAAQAAVVVLSPVLGAVASDFGVSTATAGQLRTLSGFAAAAAALLIPRVSRRLGLRALLLWGATLTGIGSVASAAAPGFGVLAGAQVVIGVGVSALIAAGTTAAAAWTTDAQRSSVLSWALIGPPAAWIVGMPLIGALGERSWRLGWIALPLVASAAVAALLARRPPDPPAEHLDPRLRAALADRGLARWALAELLASCGWAGTLVYAGALLADSYGASPLATGSALALGAVAYVAGNVAARRRGTGEPRRLLVQLALSLAVLVPLFGVVRSDLWTSTALFAAAASVAGARTLVGNAVGLGVTPELRLAAIGIRTATMQLGYFVGAGAAGLALAYRGYAGLGATLGLFFLAAAFALAELPARRRIGARPCESCA